MTTLAYRCTDCEQVRPSIRAEQATLDPRVALGYCEVCEATRYFRVDVTNAPVQGVILGDVVDGDTDTHPGNRPGVGSSDE